MGARRRHPPLDDNAPQPNGAGTPTRRVQKAPTRQVTRRPRPPRSSEERKMRDAYGRAFAEALDELCRDRNLTQAQLAHQAVIAQQTVSKWLSGRPPEDPYKVFELEEQLGVPPGFLSVHLGYVPPDTKTDVVTAISRDPDLPADARRMIRNLYLHMVGLYRTR